MWHLLRFGYRRRDGMGGRIANPRFDRCTDDLVIDALTIFEQEEDACDSYCEQSRDEEKARRA